MYVVNQNISADYDIDVSKSEDIALSLKATASLEIDVINAAVGSSVRLILKQDATGGRVITFSNDFRWVGGSAPTLTTAANARDIFEFVSGPTKLQEISRALDVK